MAADKQDPSGPEGRQRRPPALLRQLALAMELPFIPIAAVVIGGGVGYFLDARLHSSPWLMLVLGLVGFVAGVWEVLRRVSKEEKDEKLDGES